MQWKKAGRPRIKPPEDKPEWLEQSWTKDELTLKYGPIYLAYAVIKQWIRDGKPESEKIGILPWLNIIQESLRQSDNKHNERSIKDAVQNS